MRRPIFKTFVWMLLILILGGITAILIERGEDNIGANLVPSASQSSENSLRLQSADVEGYQRAEGPITLQFPEDHGPHPEYQTEWWYYTGNIQTNDGRHFGYQLTFFRRALIPIQAVAERSSRWATNQIYMAHFALTDVQAGKFQSFERFSRSALNLAGAQSPLYRVWLNDWQVEQLDPGVYRLQAAEGDLALDLQLSDIRGPILHGQDGYSQKGPDAGNASYYVSQTRLQTGGTIKIKEKEFHVSGSSWMDHEYSTSALSPGQIGWDWFSIQLMADNDVNEPLELMVYHIRRADGTVDPFSSGTLIFPDGSTAQLGPAEFEIKSLDTWRSPRSGGVYPSRWMLSIDSENLSLEIEPYLADQELNLSFNYWEGAVKISGTWEGKPVTGNGYVELTGYVESMAEEF